jgi:hypothetical protein
MPAPGATTWRRSGAEVGSSWRAALINLVLIARGAPHLWRHGHLSRPITVSQQPILLADVRTPMLGQRNQNVRANLPTKSSACAGLTVARLIEVSDTQLVENHRLGAEQLPVCVTGPVQIRRRF